MIASPEHGEVSGKQPSEQLPSSCVPGGLQGVLPRVRLPVIEAFGGEAVCISARVPGCQDQAILQHSHPPLYLSHTQLKVLGNLGYSITCTKELHRWGLRPNPLFILCDTGQQSPHPDSDYCGQLPT